MPKPDKQQKSGLQPLEKIEEDSIRGKIKIISKEYILLGILLILVVLVAIYFIAGGRGLGTGAKFASVGSAAPQFSLSTLDGRILGLSGSRGKVVMVHFWATWCPPCVEEIPTLEKLYRRFLNRDFEILAVSVDEGGAGVVASFAQRTGLSFPVLLDPDRSVSTLYGTFKFPESYLIDRQGMVREKIIGPRDWSDPVNISMVQGVIEEK